VRAVVNAAYDPAAVPPPSDAARTFHEELAGYAPTPLHDLPTVAAQLCLGRVLLKDESDRLGLPAFKVLGASWAIDRALAASPDVTTLVAASAGNHGRAVAHVARRRGLQARIFLPARSVPARRAAIEGEGAEVVVVDGGYEEAVQRAAAEGAQPGRLELADVGKRGPAEWVIDGYATLFAELATQLGVEWRVKPHSAAQPSTRCILVPAGVGSLAAAAARFGAAVGASVVAVEPETAACVGESLAAGEPVTIETPGTTMAGLDCAEVSVAAWPSLRAGLRGTIAVSDTETHAAMRELAAAGLRIGDSGAAPLAALRALREDPGCAALRAAVELGPDTEVVLVATEGVTDPDGYERVIASGAAPPR
jgi:diaminopropionate ammonia-lyase